MHLATGNHAKMNIAACTMLEKGVYVMHINSILCITSIIHCLLLSSGNEQSDLHNTSNQQNFAQYWYNANVQHWSLLVTNMEWARDDERIWLSVKSTKLVLYNEHWSTASAFLWLMFWICSYSDWAKSTVALETFIHNWSTSTGWALKSKKILWSQFLEDQGYTLLWRKKKGM